MRKIKKLILGLSTLLVASGSFPLIALSCVKTHPQKPAQIVAGVKTNDQLKLTEEQTKNAPKSIVITDGGPLKDKSFNQSAWEGLIAFGEQNNLTFDKYDAAEIKENKFDDGYKAALNNGYKYWILPGFSHIDAMTKFYAANKAAMKEKGVVLITIDFDFSDKADPGDCVSILYKTKEGGFLAGYAAGAFLSETETAEANRTISSFGGSNDPGPGDFIEGFYKGIYYWNTKNAGKEVHTKAKKVDLSTGYEPGPTMTASIDNVLSQEAKMVLPVAGSATDEVLSREKFSDKYIIGVDVDQSQIVAKKQETFFTSITKGIGQATYDVVSALISGKQLDKYATGYEPGKKNALLNKGYKDNWVGIAPTRIPGDKGKIATEAFEKAKNVFKNLEQKDLEWLNSKRSKLEAGSIEHKDSQETIDALSELLFK
ncbi:BMP family ABC transporter substrate-binding protein [Metamycoplasma hyosynoviae]|uniref:BMP family ABC transporter substrate-binding protein n=1 Tax=Metamycoplasma hyosynoviae TaxID=29559 RepID=A0AAP4ANY3_9BACT|nr:BMP family ABC transporter substrate-binding protein [Metamycoplasma hyosynoviae]MDC8914384.1 BMP family ABC transporter substrate-binding protein [Metamycoplasma hyosynoviae]MDC8927282.1 BMP family ABC transporter substrate-binding protein [Metamycoplasma hyosynoviae]MDD7912321.1 BMP family ABC transporter substrate-binding protein [Metamycoplasma hyosynoviae]MDI3047958.1 BMP family ABC transporter substrate-binding protein [Metamycoplasma hyosynoviae]MDI3102976.1 BMP family ABC transporte